MGTNKKEETAFDHLKIFVGIKILLNKTHVYYYNDSALIKRQDTGAQLAEHSKVAKFQNLVKLQQLLVKQQTTNRVHKQP